MTVESLRDLFFLLLEVIIDLRGDRGGIIVCVCV